MVTVSNQTQKMEVRNDVIAFLGMDNEDGELVGSNEHSNIFLYDTKDDQPRAIQEEYYNFFDEESSRPVASPVCGGFEEYFISSMYDNYEDSYS